MKRDSISIERRGAVSKAWTIIYKKALTLAIPRLSSHRSFSSCLLHQIQSFEATLHIIHLLISQPTHTFSKKSTSFKMFVKNVLVVFALAITAIASPVEKRGGGQSCANGFTQKCCTSFTQPIGGLLPVIGLGCTDINSELLLIRTFSQ